jgi:outer membrane protein OmpA-like peptidoglycan-associated protein
MTGKTILFETNKSAIKRDSLALLDSLTGIISNCKDVITGRGIQVSGHTDSVGNDAYNQKLSTQRADAVKDYLVKKGVDTALIKSAGFGESQPIASNDTEAGRSQNRRITFDINPE